MSIETADELLADLRRRLDDAAALELPKARAEAYHRIVIRVHIRRHYIGDVTQEQDNALLTLASLAAQRRDEIFPPDPETQPCSHPTEMAPASVQ